MVSVREWYSSKVYAIYKGEEQLDVMRMFEVATIKSKMNRILLLIFWYFKSPCVQWLTISEYNAERFCSVTLLKNDKITENIIIDLSSQIKETYSSLRFLGITSFIIFCTLLLSVSGVEIKLNVQGLELLMTNKLREIFFFVSATLTLLYFYKLLPARLLERCLKKVLNKSDVPEFVRYKYLNGIDVIIDFMHPTRTFPFSLSYCLVAFLISCVAVLYLVAFLVCLLFGYYYIGKEIVQHPGLPAQISNALLTYDAVTIVCYFISDIVFFYFPFRHSRLSATDSYKKVAAVLPWTELDNFSKERLGIYRNVLRKELRYLRLFLRLTERAKEGKPKESDCPTKRN